MVQFKVLAYWLLTTLLVVVIGRVGAAGLCNRYLQQRGYDVTYLPVQSDGRVDLQQLAEAMRPDTVLVSIMAVNNEIGVRQPLTDIGTLCRERKVFFHTDAAQVGRLWRVPGWLARTCFLFPFLHHC
jgi:aspartate aminotransferase-like enzyme